MSWRSWSVNVSVWVSTHADWQQKPKFGRTLKIAAPVGVAVAVVAQIIAIVAHFTTKVRLRVAVRLKCVTDEQNSLIDQCTSNTTGATEIDVSRRR